MCGPSRPVRTRRASYIWVDMEQSPYVDVTLEITEELRRAFPGVGVCLQAYLHRTRTISADAALGAGVRLVKGAYREPPAIAFPEKRDVDANYLALGRTMIDDRARGGSSRACLARTTRASSPI